jgi:hypothetical protein
LETKLVYAGQYKNNMDLFDLTFEKKLTFSSPISKKGIFKETFSMFWQPKKMFEGHIKVLGGPHVARGPDVAQACYRVSLN